ncbi:MAG: serine hydrolase domain-containing protein, partial [Stackebrandtia sp.]
MSTILSRAAVFATVCAAVASFAAAPALAQEPDNQAPDLSRLGRLVDKTVEEQLDGGEVPGAAVSIVAGGEEVYSRGYGLADVEAKTPVDARTTGFFTSSMAKLFTAAAVLQLERQDKLDLDADVNEYLGTFRIADTYPGKPMTLRHLLTHTSGFDPDYGMVDTSTNSAAQLPSLGDSLAAKQPPREEPPGTVLAYDNYGVALAGYIVERVSGVDYAKYVNEHVYDALGMTGSTASQPRPSNIDKRLATGY